MAQFSMEIIGLSGSLLNGNQQYEPPSNIEAASPGRPFHKNAINCNFGVMVFWGWIRTTFANAGSSSVAMTHGRCYSVSRSETEAENFRRNYNELGSFGEIGDLLVASAT